MDLYSQESEALTLQQSGWDGQTNSIVSGIPLAKKFSSTTGRKQKATPTSPKQISLFGEVESTSSQVDFHVSPTAPQENALARKMRDTSGRRCLEQYGRFNHDSLWAKMFPGLLIGMEGWYSKRCRLTWKLKGTKSGRLYFQLVPSTLPIEKTGYGLLRTPSAQEPGVSVDRLVTKDGEPARIGERAYDKHTGSLAQVGLIQQVQMGLLPTPQAIDGSGKGRNPRLKTDCNRDPNQPGSWRGDLKDFAVNGLLPTPKVGGKEGYETRAKRQGHEKAISHLEAFVEYHTMMLPTPMASDCGDKVTGLENQDSLVKMSREITGQTSQLNPRFVMEMMGFPPDWTELPFLSGETNPSKPEETLLCPK